MKTRNEREAHYALAARADEAERFRRTLAPTRIADRFTPAQRKAHEGQQHAMKRGLLRRIPTIFGAL